MLAKHLKNKGNIFILDEPTTGLHASDIKSIMKLLEGFVERGNTVIIIEHNLDVMKQADYIIDIGPMAVLQVERLFSWGHQSKCLNRLTL